MNKVVILFVFVATLLISCKNDKDNNHEHAHSGIEPIAYTIYTKKTELFVEFKPLIKGHVSKFAAHFTTLGENFKAVTEGSVSLKLVGKKDQPSYKAKSPSSPGIFRLSLKPINTGEFDLVFILQTKEFSDTIVIENISVYPNEELAIKDVQESSIGEEIVYLKEQAWKIEFSNQSVEKQVFTEVIKTTGEILPAQGDEVVITAKNNGIVTFGNNQKLIGSSVNTGESLFAISGGGLLEGNIDSDYREAKANYEKAKANYERAKELIKDKIISEKAFQEIELEYKNTNTIYSNISKGYSSKGKNISSPIKGYIKNIMVNEGEYVKVGQPIASVSQNQKLILKAEVPQKYFSKLSNISSANFITPYDNHIYNTDSLNGKFISYGKNTNDNAFFIPVNFEIDNLGDIIPGSYIEVYLKTRVINDALVIPSSAIIEEQGVYYAYVQTSGEGFQKRELKLGSNDGFSSLVLSGIKENERVVTKGAYQIKLATMSGKMPAHGHEH